MDRIPAQPKKLCHRCEEWHNIEEFGIRNENPDGRNASCKKSFRKYKEGFNKFSLMAALELYRDTLPSLKLLNPNQYKRPDAYDNYITEIRKNNINPINPTHES